MHLLSQPRIYFTHLRLVTICISFTFPPLMKSLTPIVVCLVGYQPPVAHTGYQLERVS